MGWPFLMEMEEEHRGQGCGAGPGSGREGQLQRGPAHREEVVRQEPNGQGGQLKGPESSGDPTDSSHFPKLG